jgi:uncharacterized protein (TIGR03437 family)
MKLRSLILVSIVAALSAVAQPVVVDGGVLNGASFAKDANGLGSPVGVGSLVSIFGTNLGSTLAAADSVPFSTQLGGVSVTFGGKSAAMRNVIPGSQFSQLNVQIPYDVLPSGTTSGSVDVVVTVNGTPSAPKKVSIIPAAPGVFSIPAGAGYGVLITNDGKIAAPVSASGSIGVPTRPIARGETCFFYAAGLGAMTPPLKEGAVDLSALHNAVVPTVLVGGITAQVAFAGAAPQFPGVYQLNITIPQNAPTGDNVPLQIQSADGTVTSTNAVVIAVQ